jgi:hypothetical protein
LISVVLLLNKKERVMKMRGFSAMLAFAFLLTPAFAQQVSPCLTITTQINADLNKYAADIKTQQLPWMQLSWLQKELGEVAAKKIADNQSEYEWHCAATGAYLLVESDPAGHVFEVKGMYSNENGAGLFGAVLGKPTLLPPPLPIPVLEVNPTPKISEPSAAVVNAAPAKVREFAENVKACKPGTYDAPRHDMATDKSPAAPQRMTILGYKEGKCLVESPIKYGSQNILMKCSYSQESLNFIAAKQLKAATQPPGKAFKDGKPSAEETQNVMRILQECQLETPES